MEKVKLEGSFKDLKVEVPNIEEYKKEAKAIEEKLINAQSEEDSISAVREYFALEDTYNTVSGIIYIHFTQDTTNKEYCDAQEKMDDLTPLFTELFTDLEDKILSSKYVAAIEKEFGSKFIACLKIGKETFSKEIIEDLQQENKLVSEYSKLKSSAQIPFEDKVYNLPQMAIFVNSKDRDTRKNASKAVWAFYEEHDEEFGNIYDKLVKVRTKMAKKLGYKSYTELGYKKMLRLDYGPEEIKVYRKQLEKYLVPVTDAYRKKQIERLGINDPKYYDYSLIFADGNSVPNGNTQELTDAAEKLYHEMNDEVGHYFTFLKEHELLDLEARKGKQGGGYEAPLNDLKCPFIFSNFNGTDGDVGVLTHEFGHALQAFLGANIEAPCDRSPGMECCEMHSMSMEFLAYPYLHYLFDEDNLKKYRYGHLLDSLLFIPYGASVDEFQHVVYENPELTPAQRKAEWRKIEKKFLPHLKYDNESKFLEEGGFWYKQAHIFELPFYYIDYTIAQVVSFEFLVESEKDYDKTLAKYLTYCRLGGKYNYKELLKKANIKDPMEPGVIEDLMKDLVKVIEKYEEEYNK